MDVEYENLRVLALLETDRAYAPYSKYPVGCAVLCSDGACYSGANVENASYGLTLCAECSVVSQVGARPGVKIRKIVCVDRHGEIISPCGRCRQLLSEFAEAECTIQLSDGVRSFASILPHAFGPGELDAGRERAEES